MFYTAPTRCWLSEDQFPPFALHDEQSSNEREFRKIDVRLRLLLMFPELDVQLRAGAWRKWSPMIVNSDDGDENEDDSGDEIYESRKVMDRVVDADYTGIEDLRRCVVVDHLKHPWTLMSYE